MHIAMGECSMCGMWLRFGNVAQSEELLSPMVDFVRDKLSSEFLGSKHSSQVRSTMGGDVDLCALK